MDVRCPAIYRVCSYLPISQTYEQKDGLKSARRTRPSLDRRCFPSACLKNPYSVTPAEKRPSVTQAACPSYTYVFRYAESVSETHAFYRNVIEATVTARIAHLRARLKQGFLTRWVAKRPDPFFPRSADPTKHRSVGVLH
jgi:hypothetical protein